MNAWFYRDAQIERLDEQRRHLVQSHERYVDELTNDYERKLDEDRQSRMQHEEEKQELHRELAETQVSDNHFIADRHGLL